MYSEGLNVSGIRPGDKTFLVCDKYLRWTTMIFGVMKDDGLSIHILASINCYATEAPLKNGVKTFSIIVNHFTKF